MLANKVNELNCSFLTVAEHKDINKIGNRFAVARTRTACNNQRSKLGSVLGIERYSRKVKHIENIGIAQFILERKAEHIKFIKRISALKRPQLYTVLTHFFFHINIGSKHTLAPRIVKPVDNGVQNLHAEMRHSDLICIREAECISDVYFVLIFYYAVQLAADVASRLLNLLQNFFDFL